MIKKSIIIGTVMVVTISLTGCSYKASESGLTKIGYEEKLLNDGTYELIYYGSGFSKHNDIVKLWHKRAKELCVGQKYESDTKNEHWISNSYTVLPPFFFKSKSAAPSIEGKLRCKSEEENVQNAQ